ISPLGAVEKKNNGVHTGWRRIHDLSNPPGISVNDGIPQSYGTLLYQTLDDAISLIAKHGKKPHFGSETSKMPFAQSPSPPTTTGFSSLNGKEGFMSISSFHSVFEPPPCYSISSAKVYTGFWIGYLIVT